MLTFPAARPLVVILAHAHDGNGKLNPGEHDPIGDPEDDHGQPPHVRMADQMPKVRDIKPKQHADECRRNTEADGHVYNIESHEFWHEMAPLKEWILS